MQGTKKKIIINKLLTPYTRFTSNQVKKTEAEIKGPDVKLANHEQQNSLLLGAGFYSM